MQWRAGDSRAGGELLERHFESLHRFFWSKANLHVEDLVQQTFMACVASRDGFRGESSFRGYLFALARRTLADHYRKHYRTRTFDFTTTSVIALQQSPTGRLAQQEDDQLLALAMQSIPVDQQIALELTYWEGLSVPEIAEVLAVPENTIYSHLRRAKMQLRKALDGLSDDPSRRDEALGALCGDD
jgi:RNA polymerase sigma-70 factor (ECF subfamily)